MFSDHPIVARNSDGIPRVISIGRLSKPKDTKEETEQSLHSMHVQDEKFLDAQFPVPKFVDFLGEQSSGMIRDRETMKELWRRIKAKECDLVVAEDISRIFRNPRLQWDFVQDAVDAGVRVICIADNLDTADDNWFVALTIATVRHGLHIPDTRRRIKRKSTTAFEQGGEVCKVRFAYARVSREDAAAGTYGPKGLRVRRLSEWTWVFLEIKRRFHEGQKPFEVVAWMNAQGIPTGLYATSKRWTIKLLRSILEHPGLHGTRQFAREISVLVFDTGAFRREANAEPKSQYVPELAHMTREEQEEMLAAVGWKINWGGIKPPAPPHQRKGIPRGHSLWPGQAVLCSACGAMLFVFGKYLKCRNALRASGQTCWNHVLVPVAPIRKFIVELLVKHFHSSSAFREVLLPAVKEQLQQHQQQHESSRGRLSAEIAILKKKEQNLRQSIGIAEELTGEQLQSLVVDLASVTKELTLKVQQAQAADTLSEPPSETTDDQIAERLEDVLTFLVGSSFEMAETIRRLIPKCVIVPIQAWDGGQVYPRVKLYVRGNMEDFEQLDEIVVDLFEPPVYIQHLAAAVKLRSQQPRPTLKQIGKALGTSYMTIKRSLHYAKVMEELGVSEPFRELHSKPENAARWRHAS
jgi:Resolvase, N terminal domain